MAISLRGQTDSMIHYRVTGVLFIVCCSIFVILIVSFSLLSFRILVEVASSTQNVDFVVVVVLGY